MDAADRPAAFGGPNLGGNPMSKFQAFALATTLATFGLVVLGGIVRVTDSGLGCPDWPRCHGSFIPPAETEIWIEWSHRLAASVIGAAILGLAIAAWRSQRSNRLVVWTAGISLIVLVGQVTLGAIAVERELPPEIVALHLVTGLALLSTLIVVTVAAFRGTPGALRLPWSAARRGLPLLAGTFAVTVVVMWLGAYMTESTAAYACDGWPLCNGAVIPEFDSAVRIHWTHRLLVVVLGVLLAVCTHRARKDQGRGSTAHRLALALGVLFAAQVLVGAGNVWTDMSQYTSITHLVLGSLIWAGLILLIAESLYAPAERAPDRRTSRQSLAPSPGAGT
ncbi:MAG: hypothetical protein GEU28_12005 [Dehalococcoidia bacterium]|nr:hypothetical protein [Dehalococcoidia bacterium]